MLKIKHAQFEEEQQPYEPQPTDFTDVDVRRLHGYLMHRKQAMDEILRALDAMRTQNPRVTLEDLKTTDLWSMIETSLGGDNWVLNPRQNPLDINPEQGMI